jgi:hypothetical protein
LSEIERTKFTFIRFLSRVFPNVNAHVTAVVGVMIAGETYIEKRFVCSHDGLALLAVVENIPRFGGQLFPTMATKRVQCV